MARVDTALGLSSQNVLHMMSANTRALRDPATGASNSTLAGNLAALRLPRMSRTKTLIQDIVGKQTDIIRTEKFIDKVVKASSLVGTGGVTNIVDAMDLNERIESTREQIRRSKAEGRKRFRKAGLSEKDRELEERTEYFGGGVEGRQMAEQDIARERGEKAQKLRKERRSRARKAATEAEQAYKFDMMSDEEQERFKLSKRYGGDQAKVAKVMDKREREKYLSTLPKIFKESKLQTKLTTKQIGSISKGMQGLSKVPGIGMLMKAGPVGLGLSSVGALLGILDQIYKRELAADKKNVSLDKAREIYGSLREGGGKSGPMSGLGVLALASGLDEETATKAIGTLNARTGGNALQMIAALKMQIDALKKTGQGYLIPTLISGMSEYGITEDIADIAMNLGTKYEDLSPERQKLVAAEMSQREFDELSSSAATIGQRISAMAADWIPAARAGFTWWTQTQEIPNFEDTTRAALSAERYRAQYSGSASGGTNYGDSKITIQNMNVTGNSVSSMVSDVLDRSHVPSDKKKAVLSALEEGVQ